MEHAEPYLHAQGCNAHMEVNAGHIRMEAPQAEPPLACWCGRVHTSGDLICGNCGVDHPENF